MIAAAIQGAPDALQASSVGAIAVTVGALAVDRRCAQQLGGRRDEVREQRLFECSLRKTRYRLADFTANGLLTTSVFVRRPFTVKSVCTRMNKRKHFRDDKSKAQAQSIRIRKENQITLNSIFKENLTKSEGRAEVCLDCHHFACWALAQGAIELYLNKSHYQVDTEHLVNFIIKIGSTFGISNKYRGAS